MELVYLYVRKYDELFSEQEFNFSQNYHVTLKNNELFLEETKNIFGDYYGDNVTNVTMFFGKNGSGKTTLLDILGLSRNDRMDDTYSRNMGDERSNEYSYFIMYHLVDNYFAFEFINRDFLEGPYKIANLDLGNDDYKRVTYKKSMGTIFYLKDNKFKYRDNVLQQQLPRHGIKGKNIYAYITSSYRNIRLKTDLIDEKAYMFSRIYYFDLKHNEYLYKYLVDIMKDLKNGFLESQLTIKCNVRADIDDNLEKDKLRKYKKELDKSLEVPEIFKSDKRKFIFNFCKKIIIFYFIEQYYGWIKAVKQHDEELLEHEDFIDKKQKLELENRQKELMSFDEKYSALIMKINQANLSRLDSLRKIIEYIMDNIDSITKDEYDICDRTMIFELIDTLKAIPNEYFKEEKIDVDLKKNANKNILKLLGCYDQYYDYANRERKYNCIERIMDLSFPKMSEGYEAFLDIIAKSCDAYNQISNDDNLILILDEPDRALHPELARNFLFKLLESLNNYEHKGTIQVVMSSHSPFIVTDILPNNVYLLNRQDNLQTKVEKVKNTFATNIYYLLMNSFMMNNTFGEYSYRKIEDIIQKLRGSKLIEHERLQNIKSIIDLINEERVKRKLLELYDDYCFKHDINMNDKDDLIKKIRNLDDDEKLKQVMRILEENDKDSNR